MRGDGMGWIRQFEVMHDDGGIYIRCGVVAF